jgi:hypothetical protein
MKTSTSTLTVNRLSAFVFTLIISFFAGRTNLFAQINAVNNSGIEYASLAATATEKAVFINWATITELNINHFEVERSIDMKAFKTVAMVLDGFEATGTNGKIYKFKEAAGDVSKGKTVYYRLKQVDNNNQVHYSAVMAVQMNATVTVFPKHDILQAVYTNKQKLLSKQSTASMSETNTTAESSAELTAAVLNAFELILGKELYAPKLILA